MAGVCGTYGNKRAHIHHHTGDVKGAGQGAGQYVGPCAGLLAALPLASIYVLAQLSNTLSNVWSNELSLYTARCWTYCRTMSRTTCSSLHFKHSGISTLVQCLAATLSNKVSNIEIPEHRVQQPTYGWSARCPTPCPTHGPASCPQRRGTPSTCPTRCPTRSSATCRPPSLCQPSPPGNALDKVQDH